MGTIPQELLTFRDTVGPSLSTMQSASGNIKSKVGEGTEVVIKVPTKE